eukprot:TRINITY_DN3228_c0_g1_i1.p1 TRINITY_DN3228_c0_g1~~TRINITY_DN3228_c0_g1_i1.p1  ORF type:complete len:654 (+),score=154.40 TRINITY_DN3228_c0_g1_i1:86-2047(+)
MTHTLRASLDLLLLEWKNFNLDGLRESLDAQASEIANKIDASQEGRKNLADATQKFRKLPTEAKVKGFGALLKNYQDEIDQLTRRGTFAEKAFLSLYKQLAEIPDPVPALTRALDDTHQSARVIEVEAENKRLQHQLEEFHKEHLEITNREVTIRRLEEKNREYERKMDELIEGRMRAREQALKEEHLKEVASTHERELELERQLSVISEELRRSRQASENTQAQLFSVKTKFDEELQAKQLQIDILINESERASAAIHSLNQEKTKLKDRLKGEHQPTLGLDNSYVELELQVAQKEIEISRLHEQVGELQSSVENKQSEHESQLAVREAKIKQLTTQIESLNKKLQSASAAPAKDTRDREHETAEFQAVRDRNRRLESDLVRLKATVEEMTEELEVTKSQLDAAKAEVAKLSKLVTKLEDDIASSSTVPDNPLSVERTGLRVSTEAGLTGESSSINSSNNNLGMVEILCSQRDRFKSRVLELESEARRLRSQLNETQSDTANLRADNVKLYEKMRYLQSYNNFRRESKDVERGLDSEIENRYKGMYEESVNPFVLFNRKEKQARYTALSTAEKVTLRTGRFFLANKYSRTFIFFYTLALHLLVFLTLYKLAGVRTVLHGLPVDPDLVGGAGMAAAHSPDNLLGDLSASSVID